MRSLIKRNKKLDLDKELSEWLGDSLIEEGNKLLNNSPDKDDLIVRYLIAKRNWEISLEETKKLDAQIQILKRE